MNLGKKHADLIRIILIDSLKKQNGNTIFFKIIDLITQKTASLESEESLQERRIAEFFTSFLPCCAYFCFADGWANYFKLDRETFDKLFLEIYKQTHGAYHKNHK